MPSFIATHRAAVPDQVSALVNLAEALLGRSISGGVTIRNVAVVPHGRALHLHLHADASTPLSVSRLLTACGLAPISVRAADDAAWARLVGTPSARGPHDAGEGRTGDIAGLIAV